MVESRVGGPQPRFYVIRLAKDRLPLLYLRAESEEPSTFYVQELLNAEEWVELANSDIKYRGMLPLAVLRVGLASGDLVLESLRSSWPGGGTHITTYDTTAIAITGIDGPEVPTPIGPMRQSFTIIDPGEDTHDRPKPTPRLTPRLKVASERRIGPVTYLAQASKAYDMVQVLGVFGDKDIAVARCLERLHADEDQTIPFDRWWVEVWQIDGDYVVTYEVQPDGTVTTHA